MMKQTPEIFNYAGRDFSTLLKLNKQVPAMNDRGIKPILGFLAAPSFDDNENAQSYAMREFSFFDRTLLETAIEVVDSYPIMTAKDGTAKKGINYTPKGMCEIYDTEEVDMSLGVNSPTHIAYIENSETLLFGISTRCLWRIEQPTINAWHSLRNLSHSKSGLLINDHPAPLPDCRGLLAMFRTAALSKDSVHVLHAIINREFDIGDIYAEGIQPYETKKSLLSHYNDSVKFTHPLLMRFTEDVLENGEPSRKVVQDPKEGQYNSFPSSKEIYEFEKPSEDNKRKRLVGSHETLIKAQVTAFTNGQDTALKRELEYELRKKVFAKYGGDDLGATGKHYYTPSQSSAVTSKKMKLSPQGVAKVLLNS